VSECLRFCRKFKEEDEVRRVGFKRMFGHFVETKDQAILAQNTPGESNYNALPVRNLSNVRNHPK
jgi:hypothetical protein